MFDSSRAPPGKATMHVWDYVPYQRADGRSWDDTKHHYVKRMLSHMENFVDNVAGNVVAYHSDSPVDMERTSSSFRRGDLHGIASTTYQYGAHRPTPDLGGNVVPGCERLYLVGPFQHPGGGVFGAGPRRRDARVRGPEARLREGRSALMLTLLSPDNTQAHGDRGARAQRQRAADQGQGVRRDADDGAPHAGRGAQGSASSSTSSSRCSC